jgi:hypothetical protein
MLKKCSKCGAEFSCGANEGKCWCMEVQLSEEILNALKTEYDDCLCDSCLKKMNMANPATLNNSRID